MVVYLQAFSSALQAVSADATIPVGDAAKSAGRAECVSTTARESESADRSTVRCLRASSPGGIQLGVTK